MTIWDILRSYGPAFLKGLAVTGELCAIIWAVGIATGVALGAAAARYGRLVGYPLRASGFLLSSIPAIVLLVWLHYPAQTLLGVVVSPFITAACALTLVNAVAVGETVRLALDRFPRGLVEVARVSGMSHNDTVKYIQLPILVRQLAPGLLQQQVVMLHATLFASLISVEEIFRVSQRINAQIYRPVEIFTALALFYVAICVPLNGIAMLWTRKLEQANRGLSQASVDQ